METSWGASADDWGGVGLIDPADSTSEADLERLLAQVDVSALGKKAKPKSKPSLPAPPPPPKPPTAATVDAEPIVELGFVSPYPEAPAKAWHFPSKVGGEPVWLLPERLPTDSLHCAAGCGRQMRFLMQLYCPRPEVPHAYHRSLMLFCCGGKCLRSPGGWRALRCNLPQDVPWYNEHPDGTWSAHGREALHTDGAVGAASTDGAESADALAALEVHFDEHMARAVAQGHLSEAVADALTDEIAAKPDSAARCEAMRRIMREHPDRTHGAGEAGASADALATETSAATTATTAASIAAATAVATAAMPPVASAAAAVPSSPLPSLPELLISVDLEGDWRALLTDADAHDEAEAQRLFTAYEASAAAAPGGDGVESAVVSAGASGSASDGGSARAAERPSGGTREDDEDLAAVDDEEVEESFYAFQRRTSAHPQQALRYNRAMYAEPLWAGTAGRPPPGMPPSCPRCGARRNFEFQLMPQLLCELEEHGYVESATSLATSMLGPQAARAGAPEAPSDGLDWGTLVVYTCSASCATAEGAVAEHCGYAEEYVWHQLIG